VKDQILHTLKTLREYALEKEAEVAFFYHEEDSYLMRFANSAISLNTNEHLIRLEVTAYQGKKRASYELITDLEKLDEMKQGVDIAVEMVEHSMPLTYQPTVPVFSGSFTDESAYDPSLGQLSNEEKLAYFNQVAEGLENEKIRLSGIFSNGTNIIAQINTKSEHTQYFKTSDAQITVVLAHEDLKWEVIAEQSAQKKSDLVAAQLHQDLALLLKLYQTETPAQLPTGNYSIVFGPAATAEMVHFLNWIGFNGGLMKRGYSFITEDKVGKKVFSDKFNLLDDAGRRESFPFQRDFTGIERTRYPLFEEGVFKGFVWSQDEADEFAAEPTGHTVSHKSLILEGGKQKIHSLQELIDMPRDKDILYVPFLHYMNIVNPTKGVVTASSRFGALLLKKDGSVGIPFNVRMTQSLLDVFGDKIAWLSNETVAYNVSMSYGARNPTAVIVPRFTQVDDLEISHSNPSF
jgi:predicted Zn-dependent protease